MERETGHQIERLIFSISALQEQTLSRQMGVSNMASATIRTEIAEADIICKKIFVCCRRNVADMIYASENFPDRAETEIDKIKYRSLKEREEHLAEDPNEER